MYTKITGKPKQLTREQFRSQFKYLVTFPEPDVQPMYTETFQGYKLYRVFQLIILEDAGKYYASRLS